MLYIIFPGLNCKFEALVIFTLFIFILLPPSGNCQSYKGFLKKFVDDTCYVPNGSSGYLITGCSSK